jgi:hypothetical protein
VAEPTARREIEIRLKFLADAAAGSAAMKQLAADAQRLDTVAKKAGTSVGNVWEQATAGGKLRSNAGGTGGVVGSIGSGISNLAQSGMFGSTAGMVAGRMSSGLMGAAAGIGLAAFAGQQLAQQATQAINTYNDPYLNTAQKGRALARQLPFGETAQGFFDAYDGRKAFFANQSEAYQRERAVVSGRSELRSFDMSYNPQQFAQEERARGLRAAKPITEGYIDRSTVEGEKQFRDRQRILPIEKEIAKAERETAVAAERRLKSQKEMDKLYREEVELRDTISKAEARGSGRDRESLLTKAQVSLLGRRGEEESDYRKVARDLDLISTSREDLKDVVAKRREAARSVSEATAAEAESRYRLGMTGVGRLRSDAESLENKAALAAGGAQRLGGMDRFARAGAVQSLELLQKFGPDYLDPSQLAQAQSLAPQTVAKILEKQGAGSAEFNRLRELAPVDYAGDPETLRREASEKRDEASRKELDLEATMAETTASAGRELGRAVADSIRDVVNEAIKTIKNELMRAKGAAS